MNKTNILFFLLISFKIIGLVSALSINDSPIGFASVKKPGKTIEVSTKNDLVNYAKKGGYIIYVTSMIDMSEGLLPSEAGGSTSGLDSLIKSETGYSNYKSLVDEYTKSCSISTEDKSSSPVSEAGKKLWACSKTYANKIKFAVVSDTWIIGITANSGIKGGQISINNASNVVLRNLIIRDAYDPFPHHEENDGYNAQFDGVVIQLNSKNIWVDHCTFEDTLHLINVKTGGSTSEKWQTYDGLLDMKSDISAITVSWNKFQNHDKTMLIGSSDSDGNNSSRTITLHHNYFFNCGQRLPMVRNSQIHIFNNVYEASNPYYSNSYCVGVRKNALIIAENNFFGSGIGYSFKDSDGTIYVSGNSDSSSKKMDSKTTNSKPFNIPYKYDLESANDAINSVKGDAGAGKSFSK